MCTLNNIDVIHTFFLKDFCSSSVGHLRLLSAFYLIFLSPYVCVGVCVCTRIRGVWLLQFSTPASHLLISILCIYDQLSHPLTASQFSICCHMLVVFFVYLFFLHPSFVCLGLLPNLTFGKSLLKKSSSHPLKKLTCKLTSHLAA